MGKAGGLKAANKLGVLFGTRIRRRLEATLRERQEVVMVDILYLGGW